MSYFEIWTDPKARVLITVLCFMWFTASVTAYTNYLNSVDIPGEFWFAQSLFAAIGCIASIVYVVADPDTNGLDLDRLADPDPSQRN